MKEDRKHTDIVISIGFYTLIGKISLYRLIQFILNIDNIFYFHNTSSNYRLAFVIYHLSRCVMHVFSYSVIKESVISQWSVVIQFLRVRERTNEEKNFNEITKEIPQILKKWCHPCSWCTMERPHVHSPCSTKGHFAHLLQHIPLLLYSFLKLYGIYYINLSMYISSSLFYSFL